MLDRQVVSIPGIALRLVAVAAGIAGVTLVCYRVVPTNATTAGFAYLLAILAVASAWGLWEAIAGSVLAVLCFNYFFLPPIGAFTIADPQNWVALAALLATAIVASQLSNRARKQTRDAIQRQREMERLYALSRAILLIDPAQDAAKSIARQIARIFELEAVALYSRESGETHRAGPLDMPGIDGRLRESALQGTLFHDSETRTSVSAIRLGGDFAGGLGVRGGSFSDAALQAVCNLVAIGLERVRAQETANRAALARQSDELKSTLLDAIAHEFQTPLTAIKVAASALLASPAPVSADDRELIGIIDEEAERLSTLVTQVIRMSRIETGRTRLNRGLHSLQSLVDAVLRKIEERSKTRTIHVTIPAGLPEMDLDAEMIELVLQQLIDNAVKYSPEGTPIDIEARMEERGVIVTVADRGPGIPECDQTRIFEKFYRRPETRTNMPGSGMGLAIAREIVRAHGGEIWVESKAGEGSRFSIVLPVEREAVR